MSDILLDALIEYILIVVWETLIRLFWQLSYIVCDLVLWWLIPTWLAKCDIPIGDG